MTTGERMKQRRKEVDISVEDIAKYLNISVATVYRYEKGDIEKVPGNILEPLAKILQTTPAYLMGWEDEQQQNNASPYEQGTKVPVLGEVAAGFPMFADENILDWEEIPQSMARNGEYFALKIHGDSMEPRIYNKDVVIVRKQSDVDSGDIAIVLINGDTGACKKVLKQGDGITLVSYNPAYDPMYYSAKEVIDLPIIILGKVVELRGKLE